MDSLVITNKMVQKTVSIEDVIECVENTWRWYGEKQIVMPSKITTDMSSLGVNGWFNSMPAYIHPIGSAGIKVVGGYSDNPKNGLPFIRANLLLTDPTNGNLRALISGDWISDARTGAQPAVAMKYLAAKTDVLTMIGAGRQAYYAVECIRRVHKLKEVRVCDIRPEAREKFASYFPDADIEIVETHHNQKLDAPSGTALMIADGIKSVRADSKYIYDRTQVRRKRQSNEIGIHSVRGGSIVGEHDVIFAGNNEVVKLSHSALSREVFADGALKAAAFIKDKAPGLYDMSKMLKDII